MGIECEKLGDEARAHLIPAGRGEGGCTLYSRFHELAEQLPEQMYVWIDKQMALKKGLLKQNLGIFANPACFQRLGHPGQERSAGGRRALRVAGQSTTRRVVANFWQKFGKLSLVFGCIGTDFCK